MPDGEKFWGVPLVKGLPCKGMPFTIGHDRETNAYVLGTLHELHSLYTVDVYRYKTIESI